VRDAAKRLARSQPAISHRLRLLSEELGIQPFERVGRRLVLTPTGRELFTRVERVVVLAREALGGQSLEDDADERGRVHLGTLPAVSAHLVAEPLAKLLRAHPGLGVTATLALADVLASQLRAGALDVALFVGARHTESFQLDHLADDRFVAAVAPSLAPVRRGVVKPSQLRALSSHAWGGLGG
jgi:DNA-binding transcriptional LysR family regulator